MAPRLDNRPRTFWGPFLVMGLLVGCAMQDRPGPIGGTPVLVIGMPASPASATPTPPAATPSPSASVSTKPNRPQPTPESGYYPAPTWGWMAYGDTIMERTFRHTTNWTEAWHTEFNMEPPKAYNLAKTSETTALGLERLDEALEEKPTVRYVGLAYGTIDCSQKVPVATFKRNLKAMIEKVRAKGLIPVVGTIPYSPKTSMADLPSYNQAVLTLRQELQVAAGPDLYAVVKADPSMISPKSGVVMGPEGSKTLTTLWARSLGELAGFGAPEDLQAPVEPTAVP